MVKMSYVKMQSQLYHNQKLVWRKKVSHRIVFIFIYILITQVHLHMCSTVIPWIIINETLCERTSVIIVFYVRETA